MAKSKYDKYILKDCVKTTKFGADGIMLNKEQLGTDLVTGYLVIPKPCTMVDEAHTHDFYQILSFTSSNPKDVNDFGGSVVEIYMGEEQEKIEITKATVVVVPPGLVHCPLVFAKINKPLIFTEVMQTGGYSRTADKDKK